MNDWLLAFWLLLSVAWDVLVFGMCTYLVFWRGNSGWWFALASLLTFCNISLFKALRLRFGVPLAGEDNDD